MGRSSQHTHVLVASSLDKLDKGKGDLWDSGNVKSEQSLNAANSGFALKSSTVHLKEVDYQLVTIKLCGINVICNHKQLIYRGFVEQGDA